VLPYLLALPLARGGWRWPSSVAAKVANVGVPVLLKQLVDAMTLRPVPSRPALLAGAGGPGAWPTALLRLSTSLFTELRELDLRQGHRRRGAHASPLQVFRHLHALSLRFHLERQTGGMTRDIERGTRAVHSLISYSLYSILPTLIEVALVLTLLAVKFDVAVRRHHAGRAGRATSPSRWR
jgi:ATP-binding cassette subfamily B protein